MTVPTVQEIAAEIVQEWHDEGRTGDSQDAVEFVAERAADAVPVMTTVLFQMVVEDNTLAFLDSPEDSGEPFRALAGAIGQEIERLAVAGIEDAMTTDRSAQ